MEPNRHPIGFAYRRLSSDERGQRVEPLTGFEAALDALSMGIGNRAAILDLLIRLARRMEMTRSSAQYLLHSKGGLNASVWKSYYSRELVRKLDPDPFWARIRKTIHERLDLYCELWFSPSGTVCETVRLYIRHLEGVRPVDLGFYGKLEKGVS